MKEVQRESSYYETTPVNYKEFQPSFGNVFQVSKPVEYQSQNNNDIAIQNTLNNEDKILDINYSESVPEIQEQQGIKYKIQEIINSREPKFIDMNFEEQWQGNFSAEYNQIIDEDQQDSQEDIDHLLDQNSHNTQTSESSLEEVQNTIQNKSQNTNNSEIQTDIYQEGDSNNSFEKNKDFDQNTTKQYSQENKHIDNSTQLKIVKLNNYYNFQYVGYINIKESNNKIRKFKVIFDSGSSWLWIPSYDCRGCSISEQQGLNCSKIKQTCQSTEQIINVTYSMGEISGNISEGQFSLTEQDSDFKMIKFLLVNQAYGMEGAQFEGIVGLDLDDHTDLFKWPIGFYLNKGEVSQFKSEINFGGINQARLIIPNNITYLNVSQNWIINMNSIDIQFDQSKYQLSKNISFVIDSGSSLIMLPKQILEAMFQIFKQNNLECLPPEPSYTSLKCSCPTQDMTIFPTFGFHFDQNLSLTLDPYFYIHNNADSHICHLLISPIPSHDDGLIILGNPFMRKYYTIFDKSNKRIGLSESINARLITQGYVGELIISFILLIGIILIFSIIIIKLVNFLLRKQITSRLLLVTETSTLSSYRMV